MKDKRWKTQLRRKIWALRKEAQSVYFAETALPYLKKT